MNLFESLQLGHNTVTNHHAPVIPSEGEEPGVWPARAEKRVSRLRRIIRILRIVTDCHPDRSFSFPKGMRSGVEGPAVSSTLQQS